MSVVRKYHSCDGVLWQIDLWIHLQNGRPKRIRKWNIPTREQAMALVAKIKSEEFEGRYFDRKVAPRLTLAEAWTDYEPVGERDNDSHESDRGRARNLLKQLGDKVAAHLTLADVEAYRARRFSETTRRGGPPAPGTLDREVELLKRVLNFTVACGNLTHNPIARAKLMRKPNVRRMVVDEEAFNRLFTCAEADLKPILLTAYETGMRRGEVLHLRWSQIDLKEGIIRLSAGDTKTEQPRTIYLTSRVRETLKLLPRRLRTEYVFVNPATGKPWWEVRKMFRRACEKAGIEGLWFHDLRRSFVTNARRRGVPESVVMKISGHKTRSIFDRYNIVSEDDLRDAARRIEAGSADFSSQLGQFLDSSSGSALPNQKALPGNIR